ncbi:MAG: cobalt-precorrin-5B (C(1))-methyltransferase CbiD [Candidatus Adiutrix sp.]|nr:cobalt-precorrin-5B (C(1))-methyltransferase CbiD [Candidatus Adiutrix sp.]
MPEIPDTKTLRWGFTTGTASVAAAVCAARLLCGQKPPAAVDVILPSGEILAVAVAENSVISADETMAVVLKDGGDDPDVTSGAAIGAIVRRRPEPGLHVIGGRGVGRVTRPGLALAPGEYAINPVPRAMLAENLAPFLATPGLRGLEVEIFVERGEELAAKTLNPRLGIEGGISILGSTGLVKPFSNAAYIATVESALSVARAAGHREAVLTTGRQSEKLGRQARPDLPEEVFVQIADFFADSLELAARFEFESIGLTLFFGKAVKQAAGHRNTHAHRHDQDTAALAEKLPGLPEETKGAISSALTARAALEELQRAGLEPLVALVAEEALARARAFTGPGPKLWMMIFDYDGRLLAERRL